MFIGLFVSSMGCLLKGFLGSPSFLSMVPFPVQVVTFVVQTFSIRPFLLQLTSGVPSKNHLVLRLLVQGFFSVFVLLIVISSFPLDFSVQIREFTTTTTPVST